MLLIAAVSELLHYSYVHTHNQSVAEFLADQLRSKYSENHTERNIKSKFYVLILILINFLYRSYSSLL